MFYFIPNLKPYTYYRGRGNRRFGVYLLSTDYLDDHDELLHDLHRNGTPLVADNGNFDLIGDFIDANLESAAALDDARAPHRDALGRYIRPGDLPEGLVTRHRELADSLIEHGNTLVTTDHIRHVVDLQNGMTPTYVVGMEDFTLPALTGLSLEPAYLDQPLEWYGQFTERAIHYARRYEAGEFGPLQAKVFAGIHAIDFDTARQAGELVGAAGIEAIATGLGAALNDRNWTDYRIQDGDVIELGHTVPRAYLRVMEILCG